MEVNKRLERGLNMVATLSENRAMYEKLHMVLEAHKKIILENHEHFKQVEYNIFPVDIMKEMIVTLQALIQLIQDK